MAEKKRSTENTTCSEGSAVPSLPCAWVFAGGEFQTRCFNSDWVAEGDIVVGVDHGISHCLDAGMVPDVMMGDFDSVNPVVLKDDRLVSAKRMSYPTRKSCSDLELALEWLSEACVARVTLIGVSGGRSDHHLINWMLPLQARWPFAIELIDSTVHAYVVTSSNALEAPTWIGQTVSLMPMHEASGVTTDGLEYALHDAQLVAGTTLGLSNVASEQRIRVSISSGRLLVFRVNTDRMPSQ